VREIVTLALDVLGLLLFAAGVLAALYPWIGWAGLVASGLIVLGGSLLADRLSQPKPDKGDG
jgi:hypothetical protein